MSDDARAFEDATYRKVGWRLIPLLLVCYVIAYLDRVNVGFAKLQMLNDLGFSDMIYAIGADVTGDPHWQDLANHYAPEAAEKSKEESTKTPYALLQQQVSLNALYVLEQTPALKQQWLAILRQQQKRLALVR